ncbi:serine hydrolase domain-containing protein [Actinoplanes sp. NPDC049265]|uniref:serine hydrolase domain-containing protein n=1 Tax=Actinoplanes sp. NPDC049265 TaxID=3363902 RepID=UPI003719466C
MRERVEQAMKATVEDGGAAVCVTVDGEPVVDSWAGDWDRDTIVNVYSTTKTMAAVTALLVADRGELDFAAPVAKYWPEFAAAGKQDVTVAQVLSHSSGLSGWREPLTVTDLYDWEKATSLLAAQEPWWAPGTASGYHVVTHGFLIGEIIRRITGRTLGTVFREEIAEPLGADFHIGLPATEDHRVADLIAPDRPIDGFTETEIQVNAATNPAIDVAVTRTRAWRAAEIPAGNGHGNARSVAVAHTAMTTDRVISEAGRRRALEVQIEGRDLVLGWPIRWGLGFAVGNDFLPHGEMLFWGGNGGSLALIDLRARTTFAYVTSRMTAAVPDTRALGVAMAMWD